MRTVQVWLGFCLKKISKKNRKNDTDTCGLYTGMAGSRSLAKKLLGSNPDRCGRKVIFFAEFFYNIYIYTHKKQNRGKITRCTAGDLLGLLRSARTTYIVLLRQIYTSTRTYV